MVFPVRSSKWSAMPTRENGRMRKGNRLNSPERIVSAVRRCSRVVPRATCLTQALAARKLLEKEGHAADLKIGVAKDGSILRAHAWLELDGRIILGKRPRHSRYFVLT